MRAGHKFISKLFQQEIGLSNKTNGLELSIDLPEKKKKEN